MRLRSLILTALAAGFMLSAAAPAFADRDDRGHRDWHAERDHRDWHDRGYYAPPVVVSPLPTAITRRRRWPMARRASASASTYPGGTGNSTRRAATDGLRRPND